MKNHFEIRGEVTAIFIKNKRLGIVETIIDTEDLELVSKSIRGNLKVANKNNGYLQVMGRNHEGKTIILSRLLMDFPEGYVVDHVNGNPLDNRWSKNLRILTQQENVQNRIGNQINNKSGIRGVCWYKQTQRWSAQLQVNRKKIHLGYFTNLNEAERVVREARKRHGFKNSSIRQ